MAETRDGERPTKRARDNITEALPQLIRLLQTTPYGEVKVILERGRVVQIVRTEKHQVD